MEIDKKNSDNNVGKVQDSVGKKCLFLSDKILSPTL